MGTSLVFNYGHLIFRVQSVKLRREDVGRLHGFLARQLHQNGAHYIVVGGTEDHVHILANFPTKKSLADLVRELKVYSTQWLQGLCAIYSHFYWQKGYGYFSVSQSNLETVVRYVRNQQQHHLKQTVEEEMRLFAEKHGACIPGTTMASTTGRH